MPPVVADRRRRPSDETREEGGRPAAVPEVAVDRQVAEAAAGLLAVAAGRPPAVQIAGAILEEAVAEPGGMSGPAAAEAAAVAAVIAGIVLSGQAPTRTVLPAVPVATCTPAANIRSWRV